MPGLRMEGYRTLQTTMSVVTLIHRHAAAGNIPAVRALLAQFKRRR